MAKKFLILFLYVVFTLASLGNVSAYAAYDVPDFLAAVNSKNLSFLTKEQNKGWTIYIYGCDIDKYNKELGTYQQKLESYPFEAIKRFNHDEFDTSGFAIEACAYTYTGSKSAKPAKFDPSRFDNAISEFYAHLVLCGAVDKNENQLAVLIAIADSLTYGVNNDNAKKSAAVPSKKISYPKQNSTPNNSGASQVRVSVISGTRGANSAEECENLYDGNIYTKWCVTHFFSAYTIFELSTPASINGMRITTANDNSVYRGRNPRVFALYGSNKSSRPSENDGTWELVAYNNGDTLLEDINYTTYEYTLQKESERYKYYKIEVTETKGASVMQMSEFSLISGKYNFLPSNISYKSRSGSSYSDSSSSSSSSWSNEKPETRCYRCGGDGTVRCSACDGRGGREEYSHVPNYSGSTRGSSTVRTWHNCSRCGGSGEMTCDVCGGSGKVR